MVRRTAAGNAVLSSPENKPVDRKLKLLRDGETVAVLEETIASVAKPLYIARLIGDVKAGETLHSKEV